MSEVVAAIWTRQLWIHYIVIIVSICALALTGRYFYGLVYWYMKLTRRILRPLLAQIELSTERYVLTLIREKNQAYSVELARHRYGLMEDLIQGPSLNRSILGAGAYQLYE